jgi:AraC-like DNA-binding protein
MKPHFHKVPVQLQNSFSLRHDIKPDFGSIWHYHPELELHYVLKGEGVRFIGDNIRNFSAGEMILLGENLPHTWRCNKKYSDDNAGSNVEALVLQFLPNCFGKDFLSLPETFLIPKLFEKAKSGLIIKGETKLEVADLLNRSLEAFGLDRLVLLMAILRALVRNFEELETISTSFNYNQSNEMEMARLDTIYSYTLYKYKNDISLEEIASVANMSKTSFCRYFKQMTNKTFFEVLTEIRISHVCRALIENKLPTEMICFESGFNNISNFYRHFKKITGLTPFEYKSKYLSSQGTFVDSSTGS